MKKRQLRAIATMFMVFFLLSRAALYCAAAWNIAQWKPRIVIFLLAASEILQIIASVAVAQYYKSGEDDVYT
jgi:hypothetical protein